MDSLSLMWSGLVEACLGEGQPVKEINSYNKQNRLQVIMLAYSGFVLCLFRTVEYVSFELIPF